MADPDTGHDIFISYAREDQPRVEAVVRLFERTGWSVFWDIEIPPGETWRSWITRHLEGARAVVVAWSLTSIESEWVLEEADETKRARKPIFPIILDKEILPPIGHRQTQAANFSAWSGRTDDPVALILLKQLTKVLGSPPAPE